MKRIFLFLTILLFTITIKAAAEGRVLGPFSMTNNVTIPDGYGKIVVTSNPEYTGGWITLRSETSDVQINGSVTYMSVWFYLIPKGDYTVTDICDDHTATINGYGQVSIGENVTIGGSNHIGFTVK